VITLQSLRYETYRSAGFGDQGAGTTNSSNLPGWAVRAGPHETIYFDPEKVTAALVTCGGLCPGLNDVIQSTVLTLLEYGVPEEQILGIRYGLRGFYSSEDKPIALSASYVDGIHLKGGTILGTSRGGADIDKIVHRIDLWGLNMVFVIGGNGVCFCDEIVNVCLECASCL
jgi:6-phosphofructokinase 1